MWRCARCFGDCRGGGLRLAADVYIKRSQTLVPIVRALRLRPSQHDSRAFLRSSHRRRRRGRRRSARRRRGPGAPRLRAARAEPPRAPGAFAIRHASVRQSHPLSLAFELEPVRHSRPRPATRPAQVHHVSHERERRRRRKRREGASPPTPRRSRRGRRRRRRRREVRRRKPPTLRKPRRAVAVRRVRLSISVRVRVSLRRRVASAQLPRPLPLRERAASSSTRPGE